MRRSTPSKRPTSPRWRAWICAAASAPPPRPPATRCTPPSTAACRRAANPRRAHRPHRIRPPPRLARPRWPRQTSPGAREPEQFEGAARRIRECRPSGSGRRRLGRTEKTARVFVRSRGFAQIAWDGLSWARKEDAPAPKTAAEILAPGDVVYVVDRWQGQRSARAGAGGAERAGCTEPQRRRHRGAGRWLRLLRQQVQPRHPGQAPAGLGHSSRSCIRPRWKMASRPPRCCSMRRSCWKATAWRPRGARRTTAASSAGPRGCAKRSYRSRNLVSIRLLRAMGIGPVHRLHHALRLHEERAAEQPHARTRHRAGDTAGDRHGLCHFRERRLSGAAVLHRSHRECRG